MIEYFGDGKCFHGFYQIPEVSEANPDSLVVPYFHPFIEKYQEIMDISFEAGLPLAWEFFSFLAHKNYEKIKRVVFEEKNDLDFMAIAPFFLILAFGFSMATFVFLCEIFHKDFLKNFTRQLLRKKINEIVSKSRKRKKKIKVIKMVRSSIE
jgi:hypothetical protein